MKDQKYYEERYNEMMSAIDKFINDSDISEPDKTASIVSLVNWAIGNGCKTYMEGLGLFECAKDAFKKAEDQANKAKQN